MAIKYLNNNVNTIDYEDNDVKKVILDSDIVWCKPFTYTTGTLPTGVASLTCTRYSNDEPSASTGTIANGGTIYYGDTLYWSATAATGYNNPTVTYDGSTAEKRYTTVGNVTGVTASGVQAGSIKTYTITLNSTYGHWENASGTTITSIANVAYGTATSKSSNKLTVGSNTYTFVVNSNTAQYSYAFSSISGNPATVTSNVTITGTATQTLRTYAITFSNGSYGSWSKSSITAYYGDLVSRSGDTVTVYKWDATTTARDSSTYTLSSSTAQYTYTNSYSAITSPISGTQTISSTDTRTLNKYTITLSSTYGYWTNSSSTTITSIPNVNYGTTINKEGTTLTVGSNTYTFNKNADTAQYSYSNPTIGDVPTTLTGNVTISGTATRTLRSYTVTFTNPTYGAWGSTSKTAYYGDTLSVSSYTVTCKQGSTTRWTNTCTANAQTDQYTYSLTGTVSAPSTVDGNETVSGPSSTRTERSYNVTFTNGTYGTWDSTTAISATYSTTISKSGNTVTVGSTTRTYTIPSDTAQYAYTTTINGASGTVGTGKAITCTDTRTVKKYAVTITAGTGLSSAYLSTSSTATSGSASGTTYDYGTTVYAFVVLAEHYDVPSDSNWVLVSGTMHETGSKYRVGSVTISAAHNFGTFVAVIEKYTLTITKGTGISTIYYKVNGASSYSSTTSNLSVSVNDLSTYYYYATADSYHTANSDCGTSSAPKSGTVNCADISKSVSSTAKTYTLSGTYTNGSVTWYSNSTMTTVITSANYGSTVYYKYNADAGYSGSGSGNLTLNTTDFTISGTTATHNFGSATRITWSLAVTMNNYVTGWRYKVDSGSWVTKSSSYTITGIDYASKITVEGTSKEDAEGYTYGAYTGTGVFGDGSQDTNLSTTLACTRTRITWSLAVTQSNYIASWTYKIDSGSAVTKTSSYTITGLDYASSVVITATNQSEAAYNYGTPTGTGTFTYGTSSTTLASTREIKTFTITWKWQSAYGTWTTATETYNYGATPSRTSPSTVTSGNTRDVFVSWDDLSAVTANRTITATYTRQYNVTSVSGTKCTAYTSSSYTTAFTAGWYNSTTTIYWKADTNCAFNSSGSTTTTSTVAAGANTKAVTHYNVTSVTGTNCTAYTSNTYTTQFTTGWKAIGTTIYWKASTGYCFDQSTNSTTTTAAVVPGSNDKEALKQRFTLTISVTNASYGTYSVKRGTTTLNNGDYIYYGDTLTGTASGNGTSYGNWNITSVTSPTFTTTGDATSGNLTITNADSHTATLYYNTTSATGGTSAGSTASGASQSVTGLNFNTNYYISARVSRSRDKYVDATDGAQYSGTTSVTGNVIATFAFKRTTSTDTGTLDSSIVTAKTAAQTVYTITFNRKSQPSTAIQTLGTAVADTSIGVGSVNVGWGGSYSETFSKNNYVSQTKSGSNIKASATVNVTLVPDTVTITQDDIANATEILAYNWAYKDASYTGIQTVEPDIGYEYTIATSRYYHGYPVGRSITTPNTTNFPANISMTKIYYAVGGGSAENGSVSWTNGELGDNSTWTITANSYYTRPSTYTGTKTINSTNFTLSEANRTATYSGSLGTCTPLNYTIQNKTVTGGQVYWSTSQITTSGGTTTLTAPYNSTVYWRIAANTGYNLPSTYYGSMTLNDTNFTISSTSSAGNATYKGSAIGNCTRISYTITFALGGSNYGSWNNATQTAYYGDLLTRSGNVVTCKKWDSTSTTRWTCTFTNGSATGYTYSVSYNSITSPVTAAQTITATTSRSRISFNTTFALGGSNYGSWSSTTKTTYYGDLITISGNVVTCKQWDATSTTRWTCTFTNGSATGYSYSVSYNTPTSPATAAQTITATTSRTPLTYTVKPTYSDLTAMYGIYAPYFSTSSTATSGTGESVPITLTTDTTTTVYMFAKLNQNFIPPTTWTLISGTAATEGATYRLSSSTFSYSASEQTWDVSSICAPTCTITFSIPTTNHNGYTYVYAKYAYANGGTQGGINVYQYKYRRTNGSGSSGGTASITVVRQTKDLYLVTSCVDAQRYTYESFTGNSSCFGWGLAYTNVTNIKDFINSNNVAKNNIATSKTNSSTATCTVTTAINNASVWIYAGTQYLFPAGLKTYSSLDKAYKSYPDSRATAIVDDNSGYYYSVTGYSTAGSTPHWTIPSTMRGKLSNYSSLTRSSYIHSGTSTISALQCKMQYNNRGFLTDFIVTQYSYSEGSGGKYNFSAWYTKFGNGDWIFY